MDIVLEQLDSGTLWDLALDGPDLATDEGLRSAVIASLFSDRRAEPDDELPDGTTDRRGWWADAFAEVDGDRIGSRLWLLSRDKETEEVLQRAETYAEEALAWLVEDGVAGSVRTYAEWLRRGMLGLRVTITLPDRSQYEDVFNYPVGGQ